MTDFQEAGPHSKEALDTRRVNSERRDVFQDMSGAAHKQAGNDTQLISGLSAGPSIVFQSNGYKTAAI